MIVQGRRPRVAVHHGILQEYQESILPVQESKTTLVFRKKLRTEISKRGHSKNFKFMKSVSELYHLQETKPTSQPSLFELRPMSTGQRTGYAHIALERVRCIRAETPSGRLWVGSSGVWIVDMCRVKAPCT